MGLKGPLVGHLMPILTDPLDATTFGAVNSTKSPMEEAQGSGWHTGEVCMFQYYNSRKNNDIIN